MEKSFFNYDEAVDPIRTIISTEIQVQALEKNLEKFYLERSTEAQSTEMKLEKFYLDHSSETEALDKKIEKFSSNLSAEMKAVEEKIDKSFSDRRAETETFDTKLEKFSSDLITKMNDFEKTMEKSCLDHSTETKVLEQKLEKLSSDLSSAMQSVELMEKSRLEQITEVVNELRNINFIKNSEVTDNDLSKNKDICKSEENSNGEEMISKHVNVVKEKTVPMSVLTTMKDIIVEQQRGILFNRILHSSMSVTDHERGLPHSHEPAIHEPEFRFQDDVFYPSIHENCLGSLTNFSLGQARDLASGDYTSDNAEMKRANVESSCNTIQQQLNKNEKRKSEEIVVNNGDDTFICSNKMKILKPSVVQKKLTDSSEEGLLFLGKTENGEVKIHKVSHPQQLVDLKKKYKNYKIWKTNDF